MWELTAPWEEHVEEAHERNLAKYQDPVEESRSQGWRAPCEPTEVGCWGFAGRSICKALAGLGAVKRGGVTAEKATRWLWIKRASPWMTAAGTQSGT